jgi:hypothetical protein
MEINAATKDIVNKMDPRKHPPSHDMVAIDGGSSRIEIWKDFLLDLQRWLSPSEPLMNYNLGINAYHEGTATWFMEGGIFQEWHTTGSLLWIHGKRMLFHHNVNLSLIASAVHSRFGEDHSLVRHLYVLILDGFLYS